MARMLGKLNAMEVAKKQYKPGRYSDGGNLYLVVDPSGAKRWVFLFRFDGKLREMGLGGVLRVSLAAARIKAQDCRAALGRGENPIETRKAENKVPTFGEVADEYIEAKAPEWRNAKHRYQWETTLKVQAAGLRDKRIVDITPDDVKAVLVPIWDITPETANRLRGRIERVLSAGLVKVRRMGIKPGENPARWKGNLEHEMSNPRRVATSNFKAVPVPEVPAFVERLQNEKGISARALEFLILTATRSNETRGAKWSEIDEKTKVWTIPGERMKMGKEHRVPLAPRAIHILKAMKKASVSEYVFPGTKKDMPLSDMSMVAVMRRMGVDAVPHGFRSSFRDWCGDYTDTPRDVAEQALAHQVGDEVERAYRRSDALEKRRKLMQEWADYCSGTAAGAVPA